MRYHVYFTVHAILFLSYIFIYRVDITSETRGISIENIIEAIISQLGPDKVGFFLW